MNELALFAGAGGGILGGKLLGWRTICAVEWEPYPASVLLARQNDGMLQAFPIWDDVQTFDGKPWSGLVDVVSGGFPCQDISSAGRGAGIEGERSGMWKHMARIIGEVRPRYAFVENSPMLVRRGLSTVLGDLAKMGYNARWGVLSAASVGANHKMDRIWVVAKNVVNSKSFRYGNGRKERDFLEQDGRQIGSMRSITSGTGKQSNDLANTDSAQRQRKGLPSGIQQGNARVRHDSSKIPNAPSLRSQRQGQHEQPIGAEKGGHWQANIAKSIGTSDQWAIEPNVGRVADGVAAILDIP